MNKIIFLIVLLSFIGCTKKETVVHKKTTSEFPVIDSKFPLFIGKIDFEHQDEVEPNDEIKAKILKTVTDFYNNDSGIEEPYKKDFGLKDSHFKTIRLQGKYQTVFVIILKFFPSNELISKVLFYDNNSKQFIREPLDFKIFALYDFTDGKLTPTNLKEEFKIEIPEIKITDKNEFEFTRLWHNGTFNAIETTILKVSENKIDTIKFNKKGLSPEFFRPS